MVADSACFAYMSDRVVLAASFLQRYLRFTQPVGFSCKSCMTHTASSHTTSSNRKPTSETPADFLRIMAKSNHYIFQTVPILDLFEAHSRLRRNLLGKRSVSFKIVKIDKMLIILRPSKSAKLSTQFRQRFVILPRLIYALLCNIHQN